MSGLSARILPLVRPWCPEPAKEIWRKLRWRREFLKTVRDGVVPAFCAYVGYETLVEILMGRRIIALPGNFIEIGAFLGGGTAKLAKIAALCGKKVWVVDIFDPNFDKTATVDGMAMNDMYRGFVRYASQEQIFRWVTGPYAQHLKVLKGDSRLVKVPLHAQFSFGFIDGNHDPAWVDNDFSLVWQRLVPGGWVGFHDYGGDLPGVTATIDRLMKDHRAAIDDVVTVKEKTILLFRKADLTEDCKVS